MFSIFPKHNQMANTARLYLIKAIKQA